VTNEEQAWLGSQLILPITDIIQIISPVPQSHFLDTEERRRSLGNFDLAWFRPDIFVET
jgi:hypothetical protein